MVVLLVVAAAVQPILSPVCTTTYHDDCRLRSLATFYMIYMVEQVRCIWEHIASASHVVDGGNLAARMIPQHTIPRVSSARRMLHLQEPPRPSLPTGSPEPPTPSRRSAANALRRLQRPLRQGLPGSREWRGWRGFLHEDSRVFCRDDSTLGCPTSQ